MASDIDVLSAILGLLALAASAYSAFWALRIRRALFVKLYRGQAFGIGMIGLFIALLDFLFLGEIVLPSVESIVIPWFAWFAPLALMYWIDTSARVGKKSDPLLRDTLHWRRLRVLVWSFDLLCILAGLLLLPYVAMPAALLLIFGPVFGTTATGALVLPIVARRSGDLTLRRHLQWFGIFVIVLLGDIAFLVLTYNRNTFANETIGPLLFVLGSYCLYRSTKSLAPISRLHLSD